MKVMKQDSIEQHRDSRLSLSPSLPLLNTYQPTLTRTKYRQTPYKEKDFSPPFILQKFNVSHDPISYMYKFLRLKPKKIKRKKKNSATTSH